MREFKTGSGFLKGLLVFIPVIFLLYGGMASDLPVRKDIHRPVVYVFSIRDEIAKPVLRLTGEAFREAEQVHADYMLLELNTYGGLLNVADSIRTRIINSPIPVLVFIDNQAISAGALIAIACDSIYMRPGGNIGAATVVNLSGAAMPDKYQSFMRATMRSTAESHGKDTLITGNDTVIKWRRDPLIAEGMVDSRIVVPGLADSTKVITLTADEAIRNGYCEGLAENVPEVLAKAGIKNYVLKEFTPTALDRLIGFLMNTVVQGILIVIMIAGIYFEFHSPGVGFPLIAAITAALLYFAPLYLEGLAAHWEILLFVAGVVLLALEIFVIPGFGVAGISGITLIVAGLTLSLVGNNALHFEGAQGYHPLIKALFTVVISVFTGFALLLLGTRSFAFSAKVRGLALDTVQDSNKGFVNINTRQKQMIGKSGTAFTMLRPSGRIEIEGEIFDAKAETGYIDQGEKIRVVRDEAGQLYVKRIS